MIVVECIVKSESYENVVYHYSYRLLKEKVSISLSDSVIEMQSYGIEIERQDVIEGSIQNIERDYIKNISPQQQKVHKLLKMLSDNLVSPIHLIDIVGNYMDDYILDFDQVIEGIAL